MPEIPKLDPIAESPLSVVLLARDAPDHAVISSLTAWRTYLDSKRPGAYELILVDDDSDGSAGRVQQSESVPALRIVTQQPRGEGAALRAGLAAATKPLVFYTLCDPAYRPEMLDKLLDGAVKEIDHVHLLSGYRAGVPIPAPLRVLGWLWRGLWLVLVANAPQPSPGSLGIRRQFGWLLARVLFGLRYGDVACPFRLMRREILARIPLQSDGPFAHVELLAKANFLGCLMGEEVPLDVRPPDYRGDAGRYFADGQKVFNKPDFGPAVLPAAAPAEA